MDLFIIKDNVPHFGADRIRELYRLLYTELPIDYLVYRPKVVTERLALGDPFWVGVLERGKSFMADPLIVEEWLKKADDDSHFAETNLRGGSEFYAQICFHFQQAAEKYLKAYIVSTDLEFEKVHDLVHLLKTRFAIRTNIFRAEGGLYFPQ